MRQILAILNNDFFYMVKEWLESVNEYMDIDQKGKIEIKWIEDHHYMLYPLKCSLDQAKEDISKVNFISILHVQDGKLYVGRRYNNILADMYEFQMDPYIKGVL